eukprot:2145796-Rhodomonas_salina.2
MSVPDTAQPAGTRERRTLQKHCAAREGKRWHLRTERWPESVTAGAAGTVTAPYAMSRAAQCVARATADNGAHLTATTTSEPSRSKSALPLCFAFAACLAAAAAAFPVPAAAAAVPAVPAAAAAAVWGSDLIDAAARLGRHSTERLCRDLASR